jgi:sortase A
VRGKRGTRREGTVTRFTDTILNVMSLLVVGVGVAVTATFFVAAPTPNAEAASAPKAEKIKEAQTGEPKAAGAETAEAGVGQPELPVVTAKVEEETEEEAEQGGEQKVKRVRVAREPERKMLRITVPGMDQLRNSNVPYAASDDEDAFRKYAGVHVEGTGDPWDREANVYIAGHRLGYPATDSFLAFWDLNVLRKGDKVFVTDADGKRYVYKVFRRFTVGPTQVSVTRPLEGRNVLTLQTCTLPDYSRRLIVQAEKVVKT